MKFLWLAIALVGCTAPPDGTLEITDTIVVLHGDAPPTVTQRTVTVAEREQQVAARLALAQAGVRQEAITHDTSCAGADLWLYDGTVAQQTTADRICFSGSGTAHLANYTLHTVQDLGVNDMGVTTWDKHVSSYWPGTDSGKIEPTGGSSCVFTFAAGGADSNVTAACRHSIDVAILN